MDTFEAIEKRYSYRGSFKNGTVPREDLRKIVEAGLKAPSGKNEQTTEFVVIDDNKLLRDIGAMHEMKAMNEAGAIILCILDREPGAVYEGYNFQIEDCAAAAENMLLAITALGYASVWIDGWLRIESRADKIAGLIGLPEEKIIRILLPIGVPAEEGPRRKKKTFEQRVSFNSYRSRV
jgi:nitroreductase